MATFKEYMAGDVVANANPYARRDRWGETQWVNDNKLKLIIKRVRFDSSVVDGSLRIEVKRGFKVTFKIVSSDFNAFNAIVNSFDAQGISEERVSHYNSGIGGDSILTVSLSVGDWIEIQNDKMNIQLRKGLTTEEGSWFTSDDLSKSADITVKQKEVIRYTEITGDYKGDFWNPDSEEESDAVTVEEKAEDPLGIEDTPIDYDYHPIYDDAFKNQGDDDNGFRWGITVMAGLGWLISIGVLR